MIFRRPTIWLAFLCLGCAQEMATEPQPFRGVTMIGDSITQQLGDLSQWFGPEAVTWVNAGIGGDASWQVLRRIMRDVDPAKTSICFLLVGINDIGGYKAGLIDGSEALLPGEGTPIQHPSVAENIMAIVDSLEAHHITPVLATVMPVVRTFPNGESFQVRIMLLNEWIRTFAVSRNIVIADYFPAFQSGSGWGDSTLFGDQGGTGNVHPNAAGQRRMVDVAAAALARAR